MANIFNRVKVKRATGCWEWQGARRGTQGGRLGYGQAIHEGKAWGAHRLAWHLTQGDIPPGMCVCHMCDNPICINPAHLFLGTMADNMRDKRNKGRGIGDLSPDKVHAIREAAAHMNKSALAKHFKTHRKTVQRILNGTGYRHVE